MNDLIDWNRQLLDQLDWHWQHHFRPHLNSLTDDEYFWEPVPGCWNVQPRGVSTAPIQAGSGSFTIDFAFPEPDPPTGDHDRVAAGSPHRRGARGAPAITSATVRSTTRASTMQVP